LKAILTAMDLGPHLGGAGGRRRGSCSWREVKELESDKRRVERLLSMDAQGAAAGADEEAGWDDPSSRKMARVLRRLEREEGEPRRRLTDLVERSEHPLSWPRKLAARTRSAMLGRR